MKGKGEEAGDEKRANHYAVDGAPVAGSHEDLLEDCMVRARALYAAVAGAQLFARGRSDMALFDAMIASYRAIGLLPA